jgi:protein-S-isoprenylcysteine O-methyltransferase Ste14
MEVFNYLVLLFWVVFRVYWFVSAIGVKKTIRNDEWRRDAGIRIALVAIVIILFEVGSRWHLLGYQFGQGVQLAGVVLCGLGVAFAIWARWHLGRNWSGAPSIKEGHELVMSGPYHFVRHPIYTGMLLAILGSALVLGVVWAAVFFIFCVNFLYRIPVEEKYMMQLFPKTYPAYKKGTKSLIPFIW